jgi:LacI family transcriptional regulator
MVKKKSTFASTQRRVALLIESSVSSGRQVLDGIADYLHQTASWAIYYEPGHFSFRNALPDWLKHWTGDGILARIRTEAIAERLGKLGIPVVDLMCEYPKMGIPSVGLDHRKISELAANHLRECGGRVFAYCGIRGTLWAQRRAEYFKEIVGRTGCKVQEYWLPDRNSRAWLSEAERLRLAHWIADLPKPAGVMACSDVVGQRVLEACRLAEVMVPEEIAVLGVDNDETLCRISNPYLSSILVGHDRVGFCGAKLLDELMQGKTPPKEPLVVGRPRLVVRQSTNVQTIGDRDVTLALRYIRDKAYDAISVRDVAAHVALSYSTLNRRFHAILSRSIHDEITRVRLERVCELLVTTQISIAQIARVTGFAHHEYLGAVFKSEMGLTPGQYREESRAGDYR